MTYLLGAIVLGIGGSLHCLGMCSPIALTLASSHSQTTKLIGSQVLYNLGRASTYTLMGIAFGALGQGLSFVGVQQTMSIILGGIIMLSVFWGSKAESYLFSFPILSRALLSLKQQLGRLLKYHSLPQMYQIGLLNGFLPCGLVYMALAGAMLSDSILQAAFFMFLFGLGTIPILLIVVLGGKYIKRNAFIPSPWVKKGLLLAVAFLMILRGMNLGIPYVSPAWEGPENDITHCIND